MKLIFADETVSVSEFKANPTRVAKEAGAKPFAVLSHNKPAFYVLSPAVFEAVLDLLDNRKLEPVLLKRLATLDKVVDVTIDEL